VNSNVRVNSVTQRSNVVVQFSLQSCYRWSHMWTSSSRHHILLFLVSVINVTVDVKLASKQPDEFFLQIKKKLLKFTDFNEFLSRKSSILELCIRAFVIFSSICDTVFGRILSAASRFNLILFLSALSRLRRWDKKVKFEEKAWTTRKRRTSS